MPNRRIADLIVLIELHIDQILIMKATKQILAFFYLFFILCDEGKLESDWLSPV